MFLCLVVFLFDLLWVRCLRRKRDLRSCFWCLSVCASIEVNDPMSLVSTGGEQLWGH